MDDGIREATSVVLGTEGDPAPVVQLSRDPDGGWRVARAWESAAAYARAGGPLSGVLHLPASAFRLELVAREGT